MSKLKYMTCDADVQDEFPGWKDGAGKLIRGHITQVELYNPHDASDVVAWFDDASLAEKVCRLLNAASKKKGG